MGIAIAEIADLESLQQARDILLVAQQRGDDHHRAVLVRDPGREVQPREHPGGHGHRDEHVDYRDHHRRGGDEPDYREEHPPTGAFVKRGGIDQRKRDCQKGEENDGREIQEEAKRPRRPYGPRHKRHPTLHRLFQRWPAFPDKVVTDMAPAIIPPIRVTGGGLSESEGLARHLDLGMSAPLGHRLDGVAVAVTCREVL